MTRKHLKHILFTIIMMLNVGLTDEFSDGPYGTLYFDTAGPFTVSDLNNSILNGDVYFDENINIQDIILVVGQILGNINLDNTQISQADTNNDGIIDILDIILDL